MPYSFAKICGNNLSLDMLCRIRGAASKDPNALDKVATHIPKVTSQPKCEYLIKTNGSDIRILFGIYLSANMITPEYIPIANNKDAALPSIKDLAGFFSLPERAIPASIPVSATYNIENPCQKLNLPFSKNGGFTSLKSILSTDPNIIPATDNISIIKMINCTLRAALEEKLERPANNKSVTTSTMFTLMIGKISATV
ncbi:hypothetical protein Megvenef_01250 [Candidatus Megaera venefica]|uniref:Uncharacterized protein n=1 Tax=Candidatus Megaera venefica TaxID=2055910 RepID=A0ABU5NDP4_9RICK|nr:hypothetical protein [Candidatus Megaera venefica]